MDLVTKRLASNETIRRHQNLERFSLFFLTIFFLLKQHNCSHLREILGGIFSDSDPGCQRLESFSLIPDFFTYKVTLNYFYGPHSCTESGELYYFIQRPLDFKSFPQLKRNSIVSLYWFFLHWYQGGIKDFVN